MKFHNDITPNTYLNNINNRWSISKTKVYFLASALLLLLAVVSTSLGYRLSLTSLSVFAQTSEDEYVDESYADYDRIVEEGCNTLGISIYGELGTYSDGAAQTTSNDIRLYINTYADHPNIKAIWVDVDSGGGSPVAGDEIRELLAAQTIPVVAEVRSLSGSAAYMAILSADRIFAHRYGSVGSIGVIMNYYDYTKKNEKDGIEYKPILSAPGKDSGSADRPMTEEERTRFQSEIDFLFDGFVNDVAENRNLAKDKVLTLADGTTILAHLALQAGLIDELGSTAEINNYLKAKINEEPVVCRFNNNDVLL